MRTEARLTGTPHKIAGTNNMNDKSEIFGYGVGYDTYAKQKRRRASDMQDYALAALAVALIILSIVLA